MKRLAVVGGVIGIGLCITGLVLRHQRVIEREQDERNARGPVWCGVGQTIPPHLCARRTAASEADCALEVHARRCELTFDYACMTYTVRTKNLTHEMCFASVGACEDDRLYALGDAELTDVGECLIYRTHP